MNKRKLILTSGIANTLPNFPTTFISQHRNGLNLIFRDDYISIDCAFDKINNVDSFMEIVPCGLPVSCLSEVQTPEDLLSSTKNRNLRSRDFISSPINL